MKLRSFFVVLAAGVVALLALSAGGIYWLTAHTPLNLLQGGPTTTPTAAIFVPKQSPAMLSLLVNPDRLEALRQVFVSPEERKRSHAEFERIKNSLLANTGLDYGRDIQPWLGDEITLAVTAIDLDRDSSNGKQAGVLLALATSDPERSREVLELFWQKQRTAGEELVVEPYQGVKLIYRQSPIPKEPASSLLPIPQVLRPFPSGLPPTFTTAIVGGSTEPDRNSFVLFANHPKVLREAINNVQATNLNLDGATDYQKAIQQLERGRIALAFANFSQLADWIGAQPSDRQDTKTSLLSPTSGVISLGTNPQGLLAETAFVAPEGQAFSVTSPLSEPVKALQYIPSMSPFAAASADLESLWNDISSELFGGSSLSKLVNQAVTDLEKSWGVNLPQDIFSWVKGEYALGLYPRPDRSQPDWIFVAEKSPESQQAIARLDAIAQQQEYSIGSFMLGDQKIAAWTRLTTEKVKGDPKKHKTAIIKAEAKAVHATVGNYEIFTTSVEAMDEALKALRSGTLANNPNFQTSIASLPASNYGYLYLDWLSSRTIWEQQIPLLRLIELSAQPFFDHLRSLTISSIGRTSDIHRANIFIKLV